MKILEIIGNRPLSGTVRIGGAKNSAVALIPACILTENKVTLTNVPNISDINDLENIMAYYRNITARYLFNQGNSGLSGR